MLSSICACASRAVTAPHASRIRSASVVLPWSMCAMIEKLRIRSAGNDMRGCALVSVIRAADRPAWGTLRDGMRSVNAARLVAARLRGYGGPTTLVVDGEPHETGRL